MNPMKMSLAIRILIAFREENTSVRAVDLVAALRKDTLLEVAGHGKRVELRNLRQAEQLIGGEPDLEVKVVVLDRKDEHHHHRPKPADLGLVLCHRHKHHLRHHLPNQGSP